MSTALVTGATSGIGAAYARALAGQGHGVVLVGRDVRRLDEIAREVHACHGIVAEPLRADLTHADELAVVEARASSVDVLVNAAGSGTIGRFDRLDVRGEVDEIALDVIAPVRLCHAALPSMIARGRGVIVNVASIGAFRALPLNATYGACKAYVLRFTEALAEELRGTGVRVQALCPGFTRTAFHERQGVDASRIPAMFWGDADDVVAESLRRIGKRNVVVIPRAWNRALVAVARVTPPKLFTRATRGVLSKFC